MTTAHQPEIARTVESVLATHRVFGDSDYITQQYHASCDRRIAVIASSLAGAKRLGGALGKGVTAERHNLFGNTVVRCAIQHAHTQIAARTHYGLPLSVCDEVFDAAAAHLERGQAGTPLENGAVPLSRLGSDACHPAVWSEDQPHSVFGESFRFIVKQNFKSALSAVSGEDVAALAKGASLLSELVPLLTPGVLRHAHLIGCFPDFGAWREKKSSSQFKTGGTIFLAKRFLDNPWFVAEHLLHEALHQKLYDFRHGHSLLAPGFPDPLAPPKGAARVCSHWNPEKLNRANYWDTHRTFAAFHVYVHLSLLSMLAEQREAELEPVYGPRRGMVDSRKAMQRAHYLGEQLHETCREEVGVAGRHMVDWLQQVLSVLDPTPPPKGAYFHLALDLYERETSRIESVLSSIPIESSSLPRKLQALAQSDVADARKVLTAIAADDVREALDRDMDSLPPRQLGANYPAVRRSILRHLFAASPDGYRLVNHDGNGFDPNAFVKQMVTRGSRNLYSVLANIPQRVIEAKQRAAELQFTKSCDDSVGRLLSALAAAVPVHGRILEIGTGAGVGTSWLLTGLANRRDVELMSVEVDPKLGSATREWGWPAHVRIVTADISNVIDSLGTFRLIFADAAQSKYRDLKSTINALDVGGVLVVDDLQGGMSTTDEQRTEKNWLRQTLAQDERLRAVDLDWSTGVIIATRVQ
jgi:predicted O-methyltransferase YrrM